MKALITILTILISQSALAITCNALIVTDSEFVEKSYEAPDSSKGHDVPEIIVKGEQNELTVMADGKWLGMSWRQNGELIAESVNLIRVEITQPRVLIMYNPKNTNEQVSLDCAQ